MNTHNDFNGATVVLINHPGKNASLFFHLNSFLFQIYVMHEYYRSTQSNFTCLEVVRRGMAGVSTSHLPPILRANLSTIIRTQTSFKNKQSTI